MSTRVWSRKGAGSGRGGGGERKRKNADEASSSETNQSSRSFFFVCFSFSRHLLFLESPSLNLARTDRKAPGRVQQDQRQVPGPHPGERVLFFPTLKRIKPLSLDSFVSSLARANRESCPLLFSRTFSLFRSRAFDSGRGAGLPMEEKRDGERAGEEHESPRMIRRANVFCFCFFFFFPRPQQPRFKFFSLTHAQQNQIQKTQRLSLSTSGDRREGGQV